MAEATAAAAGAPARRLARALAAYPHCDLKRGARNLVFSDGTPGARVMIIGEAPGRDEDIAGPPLRGPRRAASRPDVRGHRAGARRQRARRTALYITNVLPWRPPQNRDPSGAEIAMMRPFMARHVALAAPDVIVLMGNISCEAGLGQRRITRLRGHWTEAYGTPALPMFHPAYLLRNPRPSARPGPTCWRSGPACRRAREMIVDPLTCWLSSPPRWRSTSRRGPT